MKVLISFVVPFFNARATLERCLDSLYAQSLEEDSFEIILVNDGSSDGSKEFSLFFSKTHRNIRIINQTNLGLSEARNSGIRAARGEYLCFVDADDCLYPNGVGSLLAICDGKSDLIRYWCSLVSPKAATHENLGDGKIYFSGSGLDYLRQFGLETFCWNYLYKKSFIEENHLSFTSSIIGEDFRFMFDVLMANPQIVSIAQRIYQYYINPSSISTTRSPEHSRRWVKDLIDTMSHIVRELEPFRDSDSALYAKCHQSLDDKCLALFSRMLSANYTTEEFRGILSICQEKGLLPLQTKRNLLVSCLTHSPFLYSPASFVFRRLFLPYIYPKINKNG